MSIAFVDFETRSVVDLKQTGVYPYAEHPLTDIWCMAWAVEDGPVNLWVPGLPRPKELEDHILAGHELHAHNAAFERIVWRKILAPRYGFPEPRLDQWHCTAAECAAMALPRALGAVCQVLPGLDFQKDDAGHRLMMQMAKPRKVEEDGHIIWWDDPDKLERLYSYCTTDVATERAIHARIRRLSDKERRVYLLDQRMNDRGVYVDYELLKGMQDVIAFGMKEANDRIAEITGDDSLTVTKPASLLEWCNGWLEQWAPEFPPLPDMTKASVRDALEANYPEPVNELLRIRQEAGKTSAAKVNKILDYIAQDGRIHGTLLYHGASTGRWAGQGPQIQNFTKPSGKNPQRMIPTLIRGDGARLRRANIPPLQGVSDNLRSTLVAAPGHRFMAGDYSQIEARIVCWYGGESYGDLEYEKMGAIIFDVPVEEVIAAYKAGDDWMRFIGKNTVLGCGFQMGPDKYQSQAKLQTGLDLEYELCEKAVQAFRLSKPGIPQLWKDLNAAAIEAVENPERIVSYGPLKLVRRKGFLWIRLPSGRFLAYADPQVKRRKVTKVNKETGETESWWSRGVEAKAIDSTTRKWTTYYLYGGMWTENVVQATARDVMAEAMLKLEAAGYMPTFTVHDEIVCEVREDLGNLEEFQAIMAEVPDWLDGCPIKVEAWEGKRYKK